MKSQFMKSTVAAFMTLAILFGGTAALARGTNGKTNNGAKKKAVAAHPKTVQVTVGKNGFSPSTINVEEGFPLTLVFRRASKQSCGNKVVFPSLNITKNLPVGKPVTIKITPDKTGEIAFTCGMNMFKGSIVVQ